jgi:hypothetical protein
MSIYDQIARGIDPIGRDVPQIAGMLENRNRYRQLQALQAEETQYQRGRDAKQDARVAKEDTRTEDRERNQEAYLTAEWALRSGSPRKALDELPEVTSALDTKQIPWQSWSDEQAAMFFDQVRTKHAPKAGVGPPAGRQRGAPVKVNRGGKPVFEDPDDAIGQEAFDDQPAGAQGSWGQPFKGVVGGKAGLYRQHSLTGEIRPANLGAEQLAPEADAGSESTAPESLIWRQVVNAYGGLYDPTTGEFSITDPDSRASAQRVAADASRIFRDGGGQITPSEATNRALAKEKARGGALPSKVGPKVGEVVDGYRFNGGDPSKPSNWKKVE